MTDIKVRAERPADIQAIGVVNISAFEGDCEAQLVADIRNSPAYIPELSLVAEYNGRLVGHIMLSRMELQSGAGKTEILALAPMSVVPSQSYRGIGHILLERATEKARQMGFAAIAEVGQASYFLRHGFKPLADYGLSHSLSAVDDDVTLLELSEGRLESGGKLVFPQAFACIFNRAA